MSSPRPVSMVGQLKAIISFYWTSWRTLYLVCMYRPKLIFTLLTDIYHPKFCIQATLLLWVEILLNNSGKESLPYNWFCNSRISLYFTSFRRQCNNLGLFGHAFVPWIWFLTVICMNSVEVHGVTFVTIGRSFNINMHIIVWMLCCMDID